jgi:hypothetical protein
LLLHDAGAAAYGAPRKSLKTVICNRGCDWISRLQPIQQWVTEFMVSDRGCD